ncbi:phospholipid:diacylglycerol acyltransferase [Ephemerocybe angulata]|uniref:Phospholipid:diacylglycerol acyltransferase n=1 Tax=Ephemerocybe angulata TaxID=980116 RepID=A0A8H6MBU0_9AGAR|nr:phospholipid:diacylglycerol acyltransferase [Tulosesus angulatus]
MVLTQRKKGRQALPSDSNEEAGSDGTPERAVLKEEVQRLKKDVEQRSIFRSGRFLFPLGIMFGILLGFAFVEPQDIHSQMTLLMSQYDINIPQLPGFDFSRLETEWTRFTSSIPEVWKFNTDGREFQVGEKMAERGLSAAHPVILIPGIISTGLESWSTAPEYRTFFREKLWGGFNMLSQVTFNKEKWIAAMMLDPVTGLDPPGVKIRAAEGIDAASSFIQGYWLWSKIVENLAVVNYDTNNLYLAPYDWRLSYYNLEERDGYFSRLKRTIESFSFKWVESPQHGKGGPRWVEDHIDSYITVAGTHLAKAMAAFLSGEMKDTVQMNPAGAYVLERFFSRKERRNLFLSWAGSASMWMKGGDAVWGDGTRAPDDDHEATDSHADLISFRTAQAGVNASELGPEEPEVKNMTASEASQWILQHTPATFQEMMRTNYSYGIERDEKVLKLNNLDPTKWTNPLEVQLPNAPSMRIYCVYGHGKDTERSYWYARGDFEEPVDSPEPSGVCDEEPCSTVTASGAYVPRKSWIDYGYTNGTSSPRVVNGVKMGEGDGTVSLLSLGAMCVEGWKRPRWNPAGIKVKTIELPHLPVPSIPRGGANTSDHVDILGSTGLNEIILKVATGVGDEIEENFVSNIREYAKRVQWD